jgi:hypothetical protein
VLTLRANVLKPNESEPIENSNKKSDWRRICDHRVSSLI